MMKTNFRRTAIAIALTLLVSGCSDSEDDSVSDQSSNTTSGDTTDNDTDNDTDAATVGIDVSQFLDGALVEDATIVDCTLSDGAESTCYSLTIQGAPAGEAEIGPFCPENISATAEDVGIWFDGSTGEVHDVDGDFIVGLPNLYDDDAWSLYDEATGIVRVTDTQTACEAAAQPDVEDQYKNSCVFCSIDYYDGGISQTLLIPTNPTLAGTTSSVGFEVGVAINGVLIAASAPVSDILGNYTIAAFDDCGGHVNPADGYHYHAATDCNTTLEQSDGHSSLMGYAMDGFGVYGHLDVEGLEHDGLDDCRGVYDDVRGYHYHSASAWENTIVGCYSGLIEGDSSDAGAGAGPGGGGGGAGPQGG